MLSFIALATALVLPNGGVRSPAMMAGARTSGFNLMATVVDLIPPEGYVWADEAADTAASPTTAISSVPASKLTVLADADKVGESVMARVEAAAAKAIAERGHFALAIPGGSILKMLKGSPSWAKDTTLAYVNHKAVPMDDAALATHAKAKALFMGEWEGIDAIVMSGSGDAAAEAVAYEAALRALPSNKLPVGADGLPVFDMMLIGVGDDGHVGSLYPGREEVLDASGRWVLPVEIASDCS